MNDDLVTFDFSDGLLILKGPTVVLSAILDALEEACLNGKN